TQLAAIGGHDARRVLPAVLQHGQRVIELLVDRSASDDACNATHAVFVSAGQPGSCAARSGRCSPTIARSIEATGTATGTSLDRCHQLSSSSCTACANMTTIPVITT